MTNFGAKIFNNAVGSIAAQQAVIANSANNIANVNTDGYARRIVNLQTRLGSSVSGINIGNGVEVQGLTRINDEFLDRLTLENTSTFNRHEVEDDYLARVEALFSLTGENQTIGSTLTQFFASLDNLALDPASIELRSDVIERAEDLTTAIRETYNTLADMQTEADERIQNELVQVNGLLSGIAQMNTLIAAKEAGGGSGTAVDERDRRAVLLEDLAERISFDQVENSSGAVILTLSNGFPLVSGETYRELEFTNSPAVSTPPPTLPPSLGGGVLGSIVYDYDSGAGQAHLELTSALADGEGIIGGLLRLRGVNDVANTSAFDATGSLVEVASQVEAVARDLLIGFNQQYLYTAGGDSDATTAVFQESQAVDLDGDAANLNSNGAWAFFDFTGRSGFVLNATTTGIPTGADLTTVLATANTSVTNFASVLSLGITDPRDIATARVADTSVAFNVPTGDATNITGGASDNGVSGLQHSSRDFSTYGVGSYNLVATYDQAYNQLVGDVGNKKARSALDASVAENNLNLMKTRRDEISSVSLDEEFTQLIRFQKAFEANARMIRIGSELLDTIVQII